MNNKIDKKILLAIENNQIEEIKPHLKNLNEKQIIKLLEFAYAKKRMEVIEYISREINQNIKDKVDFYELFDKLLKESTKKEDLHVSLCLHDILSKYWSSIEKRNDNYQPISKQDAFLHWARVKNLFNIIPKLDFAQCSQLNKLKLLIKIQFQTSSNQVSSQIDVKNRELILEMLNKEEINIEHYLKEIVSEIIDPEYIETVLPERALKNITQYMENYIDNPEFLKEAIKKYPHKYDGSITELKQEILNLSLEKAMKRNISWVMEYIIPKGAQLSACQEKDIAGLLRIAQFNLVKIFVDAGFDIESHKKDILKHQLLWRHTDCVEYLTQFFEDKEKLWHDIQQIKHADKTSKNFKDNLVKTKEELRPYMEKLIFEAMLQKTLPINNNNQSKNKL